MMSTLGDKDFGIVSNTLTSTGIFVTLGMETPNIMVTHMGTFGTLWGRQIFTLPVRSNKYSYQILKREQCFALNVPTARDMRTEISLCDTLSGFNCNKFETLGLHPKRARSVKTYVLGECGIIVEYKLISIIDPENIQMLDPTITAKRPHSLFVGEIVDAYRLK